MKTMKRADILILDCHPGEKTGGDLESLLESSGVADGLRYEVVVDFVHLPRGGGAWLSGSDEPALVFLVLPPGLDARACALVQSVRKAFEDAPVIVVIEECEAARVLELLRAGASDFVAAPPKVTELVPRVLRLLEQSARTDGLEQSLKRKIGLRQLVGESGNFLTEINKIPLVARCDSRVLICGETGTGKEVCARAIHHHSPRAHKPFIPVNCGAIPSELIENELFGHERGAFTGATSARPGLIQEAEGGTLFLDEIDCLPLLAQTKLLRFLQEKEYRRLGSTATRRADVRVIAAANRPLEESVREGRLRQDLFYRLKVITLTLPPLRERPDDVLPLARHFLDKYAAEFGRPVAGLTPDASRKLSDYDWPGNVRELEHTIERAVIFCESASLSWSDIPLPGAEAPSARESFRQAKARVVEQFEKSYIQQLLASHQGNISKAASAARKNRRAFWQLIRKHHIDASKYKLQNS
jgi:two-component system, NtrC family, response regulator GlrR